MSDPKKRPEDEFTETIEGFLKDSFDTAKANVGEALDAVSRGARKTIKTGENAAKSAYNLVETTVGKDRVIGAVLGGKIGGTIGLVGGIPGSIKAGAIGTVAGFIGGRKFIEWYNKKEEAKEKVDGDAEKISAEAGDKPILLPPPELPKP